MYRDISRPRPVEPRRAGARRRRPVLALRVRSLANVGAYATGDRRRDPAADRPLGVDQHLRHPDDRPALHRGADQRRADRRVPRCRTARGDLPHRAADGRGGARDEARSGGAAPPQHGPARADAVHERDGAGLRQRPLRADPRPGPRAGRLGRLCRAARRLEARAAAARPRHRDLPRVDRRQRASRRRCRRRSSRADGIIEIFSATQAMGQGIRPATRSSRSTCSACRSRRSASCRATPTAANGFGSAGSRSLFTGGSR